MVQIIDSPKSFGSSFSEGLKKSLPDALGGLIDRRRAAQQLEEENESFKSKGLDLSGIKNPKLRESLLQAHNLQKASEEKAKRAKEDLAIEDEIFNSKGINVKGIKDAALRKSIVEDWRSEQEEKRKRNYEIEDREAEDAYLKSIGIDAKGIKDPQMRKYLLEDFYKKKEETRKRNFEKEEREAEDKANSEYGVETSGIRNPQIRQKLFENTLKNENEESERNREDQYRESENKYFAPKGLDLNGITNEDTRATLIDAFRKQQEDKTKRNQENEDLDKEAEQLEEEYGVKTKNIKTPGLRKSVLDYANEEEEKIKDHDLETKQAEAFGKFFGPQAKEIYPYLTEGGKTQLTAFLLDDMQRTQDLQQSLGNFLTQNPDAIKQPEQTKEPANFNDFNEIEDENYHPTPVKKVGRTPKERVEDEREARKEQVAFHKESADYDKEVRESYKHAQKQVEAIKDIRDAIASGKVKPKSISNIFRGLGPIADKISNAFTSAEQGQFEAAMPLLLEGWKEVFGVRLSDADLKILESKLPSIGKDPKANKSILDIIEKYAKPNILRAEIARDIKKKNKGLRPLAFEDKVEEELEKRLESEKTVIMIDPNGKRRKVPKNRVDELLKAGGKLSE